MTINFEDGTYGNPEDGRKGIFAYLGEGVYLLLDKHDNGIHAILKDIFST